jgi:Ca-activated chloride channel family protein
VKRLGIVVSILVVALVGSLLVRVVIVENEDPLVVVHWSNSHPLREGLLEDMAKRFNDDDHETASGQPIEIKVIECESAKQVEDLVARVGNGSDVGACKDGADPAANPTIVTPQSDDWLSDINRLASRTVVDPDAAQPLAESYLGIVTHKKMAECLTKSHGSMGYADLLQLVQDGWSSTGCQDFSWGEDPLISFTNPSTSTSGRNVLVTLYAMAAGSPGAIKPPDKLTTDDITDPEVQKQVRAFQKEVDHYLPGTIPLNTRIARGEDEGHFFLMPEDNVVSLFKGLEQTRSDDGSSTKPLKVQDLVMLYPEEGSVLNSNPAGIVDASWVSADERAAADTWIDFLREDEQQRAFMGAGFRPAAGTDVELDAQQFEDWGLDPEPPAAVIDPGKVPADVLQKIIESWDAVKKPSVVTFVVDVSESMEGEKLKQVKAGLGRILDEMQESGAGSSQIGLVTFSDTVHERIAPAPLKKVGGTIGAKILAMDAVGTTALYEAVEAAISLSDQAVAEDEATRAVVVLSDGVANAGEPACLDELVDLGWSGETDVDYCATVDDPEPTDAHGSPIPVEEVDGLQLAHLPTHEDLQVFFVGFGDADIDVGRILADATDADFQATTEEGLASVIAALSGYF